MTISAWVGSAIRRRERDLIRRHDLADPLDVPTEVLIYLAGEFSIMLNPAPQHSLYLREKRIAASPIGDATRLAGTMELNGNNRKLDWRRIAAIARGSRHCPWYDRPEELTARIRNPWVGARPLLPDGLPVLDALPTAVNVFATGHGTLGITLAPATGRAMADFLLKGERPEVAEPFRLDRFAHAVAA